MRNGFTVVEFIVVLVLVSIVAVFAMPRWITSPNLDAQAQVLLEDLRYTQLLAMTHDQRFRVNFSPPSNYSFSSTSGVTVINPSTGASTTALVSGVTITALSNLPNNLIAFDEKGIPYTDSTATTQLATTATITLSRNGMTLVVSIVPETGNMRLS